MSGRVLALATAFVAFVSLGIGTATAGKLPPAPGGGGGISAGDTVQMPDTSTTALTVKGISGQTEDVFRVENQSGGMRFAVGSTNLVEIGDVLDLISSGGYIRQNGLGVKFNDDVLPLTAGLFDVGQSSFPWQEGHIREAVPGNDSQSGTGPSDAAKTTITENCITDYCECDCSDPDGCDVTKTEVGANVSRSQKWVAVGSYACDFLDQAGVLEVAGASISLDPGDGVVFTYTSDDEWHQAIDP